ncbi:hypothetical protein HNY73_001556 [Argiope bruennichi]|uniref:Uncharacterized protein n=1 Tax=Argiope bruennichi TaxID=94029 RepID=A0A8T0G263_ARGBR|nr:hypothetical protein HNY73_001556 [Argiope bruennichi]
MAAKNQAMASASLVLKSQVVPLSANSMSPSSVSKNLLKGSQDLEWHNAMSGVAVPHSSPSDLPAAVGIPPQVLCCAGGIKQKDVNLQDHSLSPVSPEEIPYFSLRSLDLPPCPPLVSPSRPGSPSWASPSSVTIAKGLSPPVSLKLHLEEVHLISSPSDTACSATQMHVCTAAAKSLEIARVNLSKLLLAQLSLPRSQAPLDSLFGHCQSARGVPMTSPSSSTPLELFRQVPKPDPGFCTPSSIGISGVSRPDLGSHQNPSFQSSQDGPMIFPKPQAIGSYAARPSRGRKPVSEDTTTDVATAIVERNQTGTAGKQRTRGIARQLDVSASTVWKV